MMQNKIKPRSLRSYKNGSAEIWETKRKEVQRIIVKPLFTPR